jgi:site-specific DNA recombinase
MNAIGYLRLSMRDQSRYSLEYQEASVRDYCTRNKMILLAIFKDNGQCSDNFDRPDYIALEKFIKQHKGGVNYLIVMDHDRFSRNLPEALMKIKLLEDKFRIKVLATNEAPDLDTSDPDVFMNRAFKYLMANNELLRIRQRTSRGIRQALESGRFVNLAPFGYVNRKEEGRKSKIHVDEEKAMIVRKIFFDFLLGHPIAHIYREVKTIGFKNSSNSAIRRVLNNCVYAGLIKIPASIAGPEKYVKGLHTPIISESDFWRCQELLGNKKPLKAMAGDHVPLRGVLKHECGTPMTAGFSKGKRKYYLYYRCRKCSSQNIPGDFLHEQFNKVLHLLSFDNDQVSYLIKEVKSKVEHSLQSRKIHITKKNEGLATVNRKIEKLEERLMNDEINSQTYKRWYKKLAVERSLIQSQIDSLANDKESMFNKIESLLPSLTELPQIFERATLFQKHSILREVFKQGLMYGRGAFRTPYINPALAHNSMILKEKGLLFIEQSSENFEEITICSGDGS